MRSKLDWQDLLVLTAVKHDEGVGTNAEVPDKSVDSNDLVFLSFIRGLGSILLEDLLVSLFDAVVLDGGSPEESTLAFDDLEILCHLLGGLFLWGKGHSLGGFLLFFGGHWKCWN